MSDLVSALREAARAQSQASELWAKGKSARNQAAGDVGASYDWLKAEQTTAWMAADEIERLRAELREAEAAVLWLALNANHSLRGPHEPAIGRINRKHHPNYMKDGLDAVE